MHLKEEISLKVLAKDINVKISGDENYIINDIAEPGNADEKSIIYFANKKYIDKINESKAKVVLTSDTLPIDLLKDKIILLSDALDLVFNKLLKKFSFKPTYSYTISEKSTVSENAKIEAGVHISDFVFIDKNTFIEKSTVIHPFVSIGNNVKIGKNCIIFSHVSIYDGTIIGDNVIIHSGTVIGSDGFGYLQKDGKNIKVPQIGNVIIEDDVEIGSNTSIDKSTVGSTIIKKGVKIDNLVMIAHNITVGENTIIASQSGISGSTKIGKNCILAGQVGIADHAVIEDNVIIGAKTGIPSRRVKSEEKFVFGAIPAKPLMQAKRIEAIISKLPDIYQEFREMKQKLNK